MGNPRKISPRYYTKRDFREYFPERTARENTFPARWVLSFRASHLFCARSARSGKQATVRCLQAEAEDSEATRHHGCAAYLAGEALDECEAQCVDAEEAERDSTQHR